MTLCSFDMRGLTYNNTHRANTVIEHHRTN